MYCDVEPKRMALEEANMELADAQDTLENVKSKGPYLYDVHKMFPLVSNRITQPPFMLSAFYLLRRSTQVNGS